MKDESGGKPGPGISKVGVFETRSSRRTRRGRFLTELTELRELRDRSWVLGHDYVARWGDALGGGGITTQGDSLQELQDMVRDASDANFDGGRPDRRATRAWIGSPF